MRRYYVYIMTNKVNTVLYIGVTSNLQWRVFEHRHKLTKGFTARYNVNKLVYYEGYEYVWDAISREKQLKNWRRQWKIDLINTSNPRLNDLAREWYEGDPESSLG